MWGGVLNAYKKLQENKSGVLWPQILQNTEFFLACALTLLAGAADRWEVTSAVVNHMPLQKNTFSPWVVYPCDRPPCSCVSSSFSEYKLSDANHINNCVRLSLTSHLGSISQIHNSRQVRAVSKWCPIFGTWNHLWDKSGDHILSLGFYIALFYTPLFPPCYMIVCVTGCLAPDIRFFFYVSLSFLSFLFCLFSLPGTSTYFSLLHRYWPFSYVLNQSVILGSLGDTTLRS